MEQKTKRCPYCGEEILAVATKCKHCGEWLNKGEQKEKEKEMIPCPICGEMIEKGISKCPYCNENINPQRLKQTNGHYKYSESDNRNSDDTKSGSRLLEIVTSKYSIFALIVLFFIILPKWCSLSKDDTSKDNLTSEIMSMKDFIILVNCAADCDINKRDSLLENMGYKMAGVDKDLRVYFSKNCELIETGDYYELSSVKEKSSFIVFRDGERPILNAYDRTCFNDWCKELHSLGYSKEGPKEQSQGRSWSFQNNDEPVIIIWESYESEIPEYTVSILNEDPDIELDCLQEMIETAKTFMADGLPNTSNMGSKLCDAYEETKENLKNLHNRGFNDQQEKRYQRLSKEAERIFDQWDSMYSRTY